MFSLHWESVKGLYPFPGIFSLDIFSRHGTTFLCTARLSRRQKTIMIKKQLNLTHVADNRKMQIFQKRNKLRDFR